MYAPGWDTVIPPMVSAFNKQIGWMGEDIDAAAPASVSTSTAIAFYFPVILRASCVVRRVWWANGATTTGGATIEAGIYADSGYGPGAKLISGSATQGTASQVQFVDVTDTTLTPGLYWLAIVVSTSTNTTLFASATTGANFDAAFRFQQSSASPLPSTATPVESASQQIFLFGFATTASP